MNALIEPEIFSAEEKSAIEQQVERLVRNGYFSHSRRFPSFLRYVVQKTLAGTADELKERTIGIEIFGKEADYDTSNEPIVRVTAAEIRKRIAQYYQHPGHQQEMRITLPPGSYVPRFEFPGAPAPLALSPAEHLPEAAAPSHAAGAAPPPHAEEIRKQASPYARAWWVLVLLVVAVSVCGLYWWHDRRSAFADFWDPILGSNAPILFCIADQTQYNFVTLRDAGEPSHLVQLKDNLTAVVIDDLNAITQIAGLLKGHRYMLRSESDTTLADLRSGPSVIVGAFDNAWTLRLLAPLHYHFANNPEMTSFSIVEGKQNVPRWTVNRPQQLATNNYEDYAIVARFIDSTTGKPTMVAAGIGRGGTISAGEFLADPVLLRSVLNRISSPRTQNVEVVLRTDIIGGQPGTSSIEAVYAW